MWKRFCCGLWKSAHSVIVYDIDAHIHRGHYNSLRAIFIRMIKDNEINPNRLWFG